MCILFNDDNDTSRFNAFHMWAGTGVVHMFHGGLWGGWSYQVRYAVVAAQPDLSLSWQTPVEKRLKS